MAEYEGADAAVPLCVDLDGTLIKTDLLAESYLALLSSSWASALLVPFWLLRGRAHLKEQIAKRVDVDASLLPYHGPFLDYLRAEHRKGRRLILATASHAKFAHVVAEHLGIFDDVMATENKTNLAGKVKSRRLQETFGGGFDYAGNSRADLRIIRYARRSLLVNPEPGVETAARQIGTIEQVFRDGQGGVKSYLRAMRPHQWFKNLLVFVPLAAAHLLQNITLLQQSVLAFIAFSLCASSVYLLNDLLDLPADRAHPRKRLRPFAAGEASVKSGAMLIPLLIGAAIAIGLFLPPAFLGVLAFYYVTTLAYSLWLKAKVLVDVFVLAGLYTLRILAGAAAVAITPSFWLLALSMFLFLSLAMVKRYAELLSMRDVGRSAAKGRGYIVVDLTTVQSFGAASGYLAVMVLALYINSEEVRVQYRHPEAIWLLCPLILYWVSRMWQRAGRGEMHDDPLVFAIKDRISLWLAGASAVILFFAN
jgi:4-hydroxybenzoate polyprenyltransferase/phosphoserine phosphatase